MATLENKHNRIWEVDALRGLGIPIMIFFHVMYDLVDLYGFIDWTYPAWYSHIKNNAGALFILVSGISVTLGRRSVRRGITVFLAGMLVTAVTVGMYFLNMAGRGIIIYFGVLHCLGVCMLLWPLFRRLPAWSLLSLGAVMAVVGWWLRGQVFELPLFMPLGLKYRGFISSDYFPLLPNLGYFFLGAAFGKKFYPKKKTLFPNVNPERSVIRWLCWCGRHSLIIYLLHQPVISLGCEMYALLTKV